MFPDLFFSFFSSYWENACQIIPPHDTAIYNIIDKHLEPRCWDTALVDDHLLAVKSLPAARDAYFKALAQQAGIPKAPLGFKFVYTPMHGVGLVAMKHIVESLGLSENIVVVEEQVKFTP